MTKLQLYLMDIIANQPNTYSNIVMFDTDQGTVDGAVITTVNSITGSSIELEIIPGKSEVDTNYTLMYTNAPAEFLHKSKKKIFYPDAFQFNGNQLTELIFEYHELLKKLEAENKLGFTADINEYSVLMMSTSSDLDEVHV